MSKRPTDLEHRACAACDMWTASPTAYHPYAACLMMQASKNGHTVEANPRAVVKYGMMAERAGVSLERAMADVTAPRWETSDGRR